MIRVGLFVLVLFFWLFGPLSGFTAIMWTAAILFSFIEDRKPPSDEEIIKVFE